MGSGGVSAVIGASDLVAISVATFADQGNQFNRALQPSGQVAETEVNVPEADRRRRRTSAGLAVVSEFTNSSQCSHSSCNRLCTRVKKSPAGERLCVLNVCSE